MCANCNGTGRTYTAGKGYGWITPCLCPETDHIRKKKEEEWEEFVREVREERDKRTNEGKFSDCTDSQKSPVPQTT